MNILIVKLSSLGDVLHNLPIVWDLRTQYPHARISWVVEEAYVDLLKPLLKSESHPGVDEIIPIGLRRWKKNLRRGEFVKSIQEYLTFKKFLQSTQYDLIIETQGLIKSAWVCHLANPQKTARIFGLANQTEFSGYEPWARFFYTDSVHVPRHCHAVDRSRYLAAAAMDVPVPDRVEQPPHFYSGTCLGELLKNEEAWGFDVHKKYVLCFHATAGLSKRWSESAWIQVGRYLASHGLQVILPWGNDAEKQISQCLAQEIGAATVPNAFSISDAFPLIINAQLTIGVDTGLTHLAAILGCPTIELYCDSPRWKTEGYWSSNIRNLGDKGQPPSVEAVIAAIHELTR